MTSPPLFQWSAGVVALWLALLCLFVQIFAIAAVAAAEVEIAETSAIAVVKPPPADASTRISSVGINKWAEFLPYAPEKNEYKIELGSMWEVTSRYWLGGTYGRHLGACFGFATENCQQYLDFTGGAGARQSYTDGLVLVGLRRQYVSFPKPYSPSFALFGGLMNVRDDERDKRQGVCGIALGFTTTLHKKLDLKWENRLGGGGEGFWAQSLLSVSLKIDDWVDAFAEGMKNVGKKTIEAPKTLMDFLK